MYFGRGDLLPLLSLLLAGGLALGVFAHTAHRFTGDQGGVPLDDAWIHFQFARNLARGDGLSFNPGQPTSGSTAPLWTLLLAGVYFVGGRFPVAGQLSSAVCFLAALAATYALGKHLTGNRWAAWLAGIVVATNGRFVWAGLSALETCLFATLSLLAIGAHLGSQHWPERASAGSKISPAPPVYDGAHRYRLRTVALFGLAALVRPEGYLLFALALADFVVQIGKSANLQIYKRCQLLLLPVILFAAIVLPYLIFSLRTSGHFLPNTYHAKAVFDFRPDLVFLSGAAQYLIWDNFFLLPFYVLGLGVLLRRAPLLSLWSAGLPLVYAFLHVMLYQHGRYLIPLIPCNAVIGIAGLLEARRLAARRGWRWRGSQTTLAALVSLLVVAGTTGHLPAMASKYAWNVDNINQMHVALGHWVVENTPPDAVLALNDIGAITYISERQVVDLAGLVTPEVIPLLRAPDRASQLADFMAERDVQYVIIFPNWFPDLATRRDLLEPVHQVTLEHNTICGGETMVVYRAHWRR
jgi:4-amino-4-deoxy-L-arabinose transferase-like glycosyltransferase